MYLHYISASPVALRQARGTLHECIISRCSSFLIDDAYWICVEKCMSGEGKKTYEVEDFSIPHPIAEKQAREGSCAAHCVALYGPTPAAAVCLYKCTFGRKLEGKMEPLSGVRQARETVQECKSRCTIQLFNPTYYPCLRNCEQWGRKSDELQDFSTPSVYASAPAQPINPGQFFGILSPLSNCYPYLILHTVNIHFVR
jgi:hypothetical protein